jgi:hypothetical protein
MRAKARAELAGDEATVEGVERARRGRHEAIVRVQGVLRCGIVSSTVDILRKLRAGMLNAKSLQELR